VIGRAGALAASVLLVAAATAWADQTIYAGPPAQFVNPSVTIAQGELLQFTNLDSLVHDVTAKQKGANGKPLFASDQIGGGRTAPVTGAQTLTAGSYEFICSIHPNMVGTLTVTGAAGGGGGGGGSGGGGSAGGDKKAPSAKLRLLDTKLAAVRKRGALRVEVTVDEPATVAFTAKAGATTLAYGSAQVSAAGKTTVSAKLTTAGRKLVARSKSLTVKLSARAADGAGNASTAQAGGKLR
jgi:plastocyanin